ncbi:uncharacterized protein LOC119690212 [Teleopsis dalmanni]|uniref:uncharacterized protein LOC119690212 n=1 Tax=Teleopsis dalmanni TaxID=139649 RepID=UPI0018CF9A9D|nr:uncharacterized protein LOC119690212 [Teleopsis dalmanni]
MLYGLSSSSEYDSNASCSRYRGSFVKGGKLLHLRYPYRCSGCVTGVSCKCVCEECDGIDIPKCRCIPCKIQRKEALRKLIGPTDASVSEIENDGASGTVNPTKRRLSSTSLMGDYVLEEEYSMEDAKRDILEETRSYVPYHKYPRMGMYSDSSD